MSKFKIITIFILVQLPLVLGIYIGTSVLPDYMLAQQQQLQETNYFLTNDNSLIKNPSEQVIADQCQTYLTSLEEEYSTQLKLIAKDAYLEYQKRKVVDPDFSPYSLAGKYLGRISSLENKCRQDFNHYLSKMETELKANHLSLSLIDQAKYAYRIKKEAIKKDFYNKAKEAL